jgi:hypothetical protein
MLTPIIEDLVVILGKSFKPGSIGEQVQKLADEGKTVISVVPLGYGKDGFLTTYSIITYRHEE